MTVESDKAWYKNIVEVHQLTSPVWDLIRSFTKWYFDVMKNVMDVAVLQYMGNKTGNVTIQIIGYASYGLIGAYFTTYVIMWQPRFLNFKNGHITIKILGVLLTCAATYGLMSGSSRLIMSVITEITNAQGK